MVFFEVCVEEALLVLELLRPTDVLQNVLVKRGSEYFSVV